MDSDREKTVNRKMKLAVTVPVIIQARTAQESDGKYKFVAMVDLNGSKRVIGFGWTRGAAVEDLEYRLAMEVEKCFW